tara:strand:- start:187 stop:345 length:159 start_codon:yes stop_codon:yes gene_type:complete
LGKPKFIYSKLKFHILLSGMNAELGLILKIHIKISLDEPRSNAQFTEESLLA